MKLVKYASAQAIGIVLILLLVFISFQPRMSTPMMTIVLVALGILVFTFVAFVARERPRDEREVFHSLKAGQISYLLGAGVLLVGIVNQSFAHDLDIYLPATLAVMVMAKLLSTRTLR